MEKQKLSIYAEQLAKSIKTYSDINNKKIMIKTMININYKLKHIYFI